MSVAPPAARPSGGPYEGDPEGRSLRLELEREARKVAERELSRRRGVFSTLSPAEREGVAVVAYEVALRLAASLAAEAGRDPRLRRALAGSA